VLGVEDIRTEKLFSARKQVFFAKSFFVSVSGSGTDVKILKIFLQKNSAKKMTLFAEATVRFCKKNDKNIGL
jgi:hypothetical protein